MHFAIAFLVSHGLAISIQDCLDVIDVTIDSSVRLREGSNGTGYIFFLFLNDAWDTECFDLVSDTFQALEASIRTINGFFINEYQQFLVVLVFIERILQVFGGQHALHLNISSAVPP